MKKKKSKILFLSRIKKEIEGEGNNSNIQSIDVTEFLQTFFAFKSIYNRFKLRRQEMMEIIGKIMLKSILNCRLQTTKNSKVFILSIFMPLMETMLMKL